jgi:hypothetical protein
MSLLREYIREFLAEQSAIDGSPDMTQHVDDLEDLIFAFLFTKSTFDALQTLDPGIEVSTVLNTTLFDEYKNINEVHLGILVNDANAADVDAAYVCIPEKRNESNLVLSLDIPRNYPGVDGFQDWLSAELADVLSHEIQHSCDTTEMLTSDECVDGPEKWESLKNIEGYYGCEAEVRGHVAGILGRARRTGQAPEDLLQVDMETIADKALSRGYNKKEVEAIIDRIRSKWAKRLGL